MNALYAAIVNLLLHRLTKSSLQTVKVDWLMKQFCVSRRYRRSQCIPFETQIL